MSAEITLLQWNIQDGGGGKHRKKKSLPLLSALIEKYTPDIIVLNESAAKIQGCPLGAKRYDIPGYTFHLPKLVRNHFLSLMTLERLNAEVEASGDRIFATVGNVLIAALHHDCHKGVDKPSREIQNTLEARKNAWIAVGDWNYDLGKICRAAEANDPSGAKFTVVSVAEHGGKFTFSEVPAEIDRQTHKSGWIDGALTRGVIETERVHFRINEVRTPKGQIASDHAPTLIRITSYP